MWALRIPQVPNAARNIDSLVTLFSPTGAQQKEKTMTFVLNDRKRVFLGLKNLTQCSVFSR
jgi:hypothetical protein